MSSTLPARNEPPPRNGPTHESAPEEAGNEDEHGKKKSVKRRKVNHACLYCRRSHMTCDEGRPCQRCVKREIGHLCHDEPRQPTASSNNPSHPSEHSKKEQRPIIAPIPDLTRSYSGGNPALAPAGGWDIPQSTSAPPQLSSRTPYSFPAVQNNEFSVLTDFLESLDDSSFFTPPANLVSPSPLQHPPTDPTRSPDVSTSSILPAPTKAERFFLIAADQASGSRDERLAKVIHSKYEAGLLKPYNYVKGYTRLSRWLDSNVSQESKQAILQPLSILRPKFRASAQGLTDMDLVFIEEEFERMLLDYDRVFSVMGIPACLWRRTGEIYKGNTEFAQLIGLDHHLLRDGNLAIYELMAEESAVNYWQKFCHVAFERTQKAVLTSCVLRYKPAVTLRRRRSSSGQSTPISQKPAAANPDHASDERFVNCCFSFTIQRDSKGIPSMIVGNFIRY